MKWTKALCCAILFFTLPTAFASVKVAADTAPAPLSLNGPNFALVPGNYSNSVHSFPLLALTLDGGNSWSFPLSSSNVPADFVSGGFSGNAASCAQNYCIAAGSYVNGTTHTFPLLAQSKDGTTWAYSITASSPALPADLAQGLLNATGCNTSNFCAAVGAYTSVNSSAQFPLLMQSRDGGLTWTAKIQTSTPTLPADFHDGSLNSISCTNNLCLAAGSYSNNTSVFFPLLALTTNSGGSWSYVLNSSTPTLPSDFKVGFFITASCNGKLCIAGGQYTSTASPAISYPLLAQSRDNGATWSYLITSATPSLPSDFNSNGQFASLSCGDTLCVAAGSYFNGTNTQPLLAQTTDGGKSWSYKITAAYPSLPKDFITLFGFAGGGRFSYASCSGDFCIAAGNYLNGASFLPLIAQTSDGGATWSYTVNSTMPTLLMGSDFNLGGAFCNGKFCFAGGQYISNSQPVPLLVQSRNNGTTWNYSVSAATTNLPTDLVSGAFYLSPG